MRLVISLVTALIIHIFSLIFLLYCLLWYNLCMALHVLQANRALCSRHLLSGSARLLFPGTMGKDKSWLSWLLTEEINHSAHRRIAFQSASWELHYPAPATHYHADRHWLGRRCGVRSLLLSPPEESQICLSVEQRRGEGKERREERTMEVRADMVK